MIKCIFTIDYEIYGNGDGSLEGLIYEPAEKLKALFDRAAAKFVVFFEAAEMERIGTFSSDPAIGDVKAQVQELHEQGHEIALHLHPQWYNARYEDGRWSLDYSEYNLCRLAEEKISEYVHRSITYMQDLLAEPGYRPLSFRAGNWLLQPTLPMARVLADHGVKIDSSVFKGGLQHKHKLDYRPSADNGYFWKFRDDVNKPEPDGLLMEIPIYTQMVPFWKMATGKRLGIQRKISSGAQTADQKLYRFLDLARFWHPLKFDFCRMTLDELKGIVDMVIREDEKDPDTLRPLVAIGHTKDLTDVKTVELFLSYMEKKKVTVTTFKEIYRELGSYL